jgi:hypothetical protein
MILLPSFADAASRFRKLARELNADSKSTPSA